MSNKSIKELVQEAHKEFTAEVDGLPVPQLRDRIVGMQKQLEESDAHKASNDTLKEARTVVNELAAPYREVKKAVSLKTKYIIELLKEKGDSK